jgi:hypothetical protein
MYAFFDFLDYYVSKNGIMDPFYVRCGKNANIPINGDHDESKLDYSSGIVVPCRDDIVYRVYESADNNDANTNDDCTTDGRPENVLAG